MNDYEKYQIYLNSATKGDADSQYYVALMYDYGVGVPSDKPSAVYWYKMAAEQGHAKAQCNLGNCYEKGVGVTRNLSEAIKWYTMAADSGDAVAQCDLGYCYEYGIGLKRDKNTAFSLYMKAAEQELPRAMANVGVYYEYGYSVKKDTTKAIDWYLRAAKKNNSFAMYHLGLCFENGNGEKKDLEKAAVWYRKAAEMKDPDSGITSGTIYNKLNSGTEHQLGCIKTLEWAKLAANGYNKYLPMLAKAYEEGTYVQKNNYKAARIYAMAIEILLAEANKGNETAMSDLADCYEKGMGVKKDKKLALEWRIKAAEQGSYESQEKLAEYYDNKLFGKDKDKNAFKMYKLLAENNNYGNHNYKHKYNLAWCYYFGKGTITDKNKAFYWFNEAYDNGNGYEYALSEIVDCYRTGIGTDKDPEKAFELLKSAYDRGSRSKWLMEMLSEFYEKGIGTEADFNKAVEIVALLHLILSENKKANFQYMREIQDKFFDFGEKNSSFAFWYLAKCVMNKTYIKEDDESSIQKSLFFSNDESTQKDMLKLAVSKEPVYPDAYYDYAKLLEKNKSNEYEKYYALAEEAGSPKSLYYLGYDYHRGIGVDKNDKTALGYFALAAQNGSQESLVEMAICYRDGIDGGEPDIEEALAILNELCEKGNRDALCTLARMYIDGDGVEKDIERAKELVESIKRSDPDVKSVKDYSNQIYSYNRILKYFELAERVENGDIDAYWQFARMSNCKAYRERNYILLKTAMEQGNVDALAEIAEYETDKEKAFKIRCEAVEKGTKNPMAYVGLANYYWTKDKEKAQFYARKSREIDPHLEMMDVTDDLTIAMILDEVDF